MIKNIFLRPLIATAIIVAALSTTGAAQADRMKWEGNLYMQTNGLKNEIICYKSDDGKLTERGRISTGGAGSGTFKPVTGHDGEPNAFESAGSVIMSPDHKWLFATNGGNNTVSSFKVSGDGKLTLMDVEATGQPVVGRSGTAKSLAYADNTNTLYVCHAFGPDHIRMFSVKAGKLTRKGGMYTLNTGAKTDRLPTRIILTPDHKFLLADILFDKRPGMKPDGTPDLAVANMIDKDGLVVFPVKADGSLGKAMFEDAGGAAAFDIAFLHGSNNQFIQGYAAGDGVALCSIDASGKVSCAPLVKVDNSKGMPSELCWVAVTPDNKQVFASVFGYSYVSSFKIEGGSVQLNQDAASEPVAGDGKLKGLNMLLTGGPTDSWISPDGKYFYQLYPIASKMITYRIKDNGKLKEMDTTAIPYTTPQGLTGF